MEFDTHFWLAVIHLILIVPLFLYVGFVRADTAFPTLTVGAPAYVSTTAGDIQVAQPSGTDDVIRRVGIATTEALSRRWSCWPSSWIRVASCIMVA